MHVSDINGIHINSKIDLCGRTRYVRPPMMLGRRVAEIKIHLVKPVLCCASEIFERVRLLEIHLHHLGLRHLNEESVAVRRRQRGRREVLLRNQRPVVDLRDELERAESGKTLDS
jgi:hypothetical protein